MDAYVHGLLSPEEAAGVDRKIASEADWLAAYEAALRRRETVEAALPPVESSEALVRATLDRVDGYDFRRRALRRRLFAGAVAALAGSVMVVDRKSGV